MAELDLDLPLRPSRLEERHDRSPLQSRSAKSAAEDVFAVGIDRVGCLCVDDVFAVPADKRASSRAAMETVLASTAKAETCSDCG